MAGPIGDLGRKASKLRAIVRFVRRLGAATAGGVALQFAFALIPISFLVLAALDLQHGQAVHANLQDSLDAATLAVGRSGATTNEQAQQIGSNVLIANFHPDGVTVKDITSTFTLTGTKVLGTATATIKAIESDPTATGTAIPFKNGHMRVGAKSEVQRSMYKLEVAMVLDNTGSMSGTKLSLLKSAANNFVDTLEEAADQSSDPNIVKISLVPFSQTVNVGTAYRNASWIDQNGASPINDKIFYTATGAAHANRFTLLQQMGVSWGGCVESREAPYDVQETGADVTVPATLFTPYFAPDEPTYDGRTSQLSGFNNSYLTNDGTTNTTWYVRQGYIPKYNHAPDKTGTNGMGYKYGPNAGCELAPLVRLTNNGDSIKAGINAMTAVGDTNIPMGLVWGWHTLSPIGPFSDGAAYKTANLQKIVVLMTDGQNQNTVSGNGNASYYSGIGYIWENRLGIGASSTSSQRQAALDGRLSQLCTNMKAQGIFIYTVRVDVNDTNYGTLKNCATNAGMFYDVSDASELDAVFKSIAGAIQNLRLTK